MRRKYLLYLEDILDSINNIHNYTGELTLQDLIQDRMRLDAIVRNFEIIGEASNKIPQEICNKYSSIEWRKIADFRNVLAHEYFGIDYEIIWEIIKDKLPLLKQSIQHMLEQEQKSS
jgi:uncharacterized protein with HEPN domain